MCNTSSNSQLPGTVTENPNPLGNTDMENMPILHQSSVFNTSVNDIRKSFTLQAMSLQSYKTVSCGLKRIGEKTDAMLYTDIFLYILNLLVSSLGSQQLVYALKDLGKWWYF